MNHTNQIVKTQRRHLKYRKRMSAKAAATVFRNNLLFYAREWNVPFEELCDFARFVTTRLEADKVFDDTWTDAEKFVPLLTIAKLVSEECYQSTTKWADEYVSTHAEELIDLKNRALVEVLMRHTGETRVTDITSEFNGLLIKRDIIEFDSQGKPTFMFRSRGVMDKLRALGIPRSNKRTEGYTYVYVDQEKLAPWVRRYEIAPEKPKELTPEEKEVKELWDAMRKAVANKAPAAKAV